MGSTKPRGLGFLAWPRPKNRVQEQKLKNKDQTGSFIGNTKNTKNTFDEPSNVNEIIDQILLNKKNRKMQHQDLMHNHPSNNNNKL
jgi:hypothetical protein